MVVLLICAMLVICTGTASGVIAFREVHSLNDVESRKRYDRGFIFLYISVIAMAMTLVLLLVCIFLYGTSSVTELYPPEIK